MKTNNFFKISLLTLLIYSLLLLCSCQQSPLEVSEIETIKSLSDADNVEVFLKNGDFYIDITNSQIIDKNEQSVFYSVIAKSVYDIAIIREKVISVKGKQVVRFISDKEVTSVYEISNRELDVAESAFKNLYGLFRSIFEKDTNQVQNFISLKYSSLEKRKNVVDFLFNTFLFPEGYRVNSYGFIFDNIDIADNSNTSVLKVFVKYEANSQLYKYFFYFDPESSLLYSIDKIE